MLRELLAITTFITGIIAVTDSNITATVLCCIGIAALVAINIAEQVNKHNEGRR